MMRTDWSSACVVAGRWSLLGWLAVAFPRMLTILAGIALLLFGLRARLGGSLMSLVTFLGFWRLVTHGCLRRLGIHGQRALFRSTEQERTLTPSFRSLTSGVPTGRHARDR